MSDVPKVQGAKDVNAAVEAFRAQRAKVAENLTKIEELCLTTPLYAITPTDDRSLLQRLRRGHVQFDAHCIYCGKSSTFHNGASGDGSAPQAHDKNWMLSPGTFEVQVSCQRERHHTYKFAFRYAEHTLVKFGQYPSIDDIAGADVRKYEKVLPAGYFSELKRATGLASHGIGIGAFVYLRRIFERLIVDHHEALKAQSSEIQDFDDLRMAEKIAALASVLPPALVENKAMYGILSLGIHELDEDTCRKHFGVVRQAIITILDQDLQRRNQEEETRRLRDEIAKISGDLKK